MLIANPIYDTVFKYLMENIDIAKGIISEFIQEEVEHLEFKAQENTRKRDEVSFTLYRLDFIARIKKKTGKYQNVLIELQKSNELYEIQRFRRYIGEQYRREEDVMYPDGSVKRECLPIFTIYFLGFQLSPTLPAVIHVNRHYEDMLNNGIITERNEFIEKLTHDSVVIQIPLLKLNMRNRLEYILSIFKQENFIDDDRHIKNYDGPEDDELIKKILRQLTKAAADREVLHQMELEELAHKEYENALGPFYKKIEEKEKTIEEKNKTIEEKDKALAEKDEIIKELMKKITKN